MTTILSALLLAQVISQPAPAPPPQSPDQNEIQRQQSNDPGFQTEDTNATPQLEQDFGAIDQTQRDAAVNRAQSGARNQRLSLYDSALKKLGNIDAAIASGEGRQEDELGEVRATVGALRSANPGPVSETSNLAISTTALANAEIAERQSNDAHARGEIRRARQALTEAKAEAQSSAPR
jgi:hypothetical protein